MVVIGTLLVTFRDHRRLSETLREGTVETVRREALNLAAAQAHYEPYRTRTVALFMLLALFLVLGHLDAHTWIGRLKILFEKH